MEAYTNRQSEIENYTPAPDLLSMKYISGDECPVLGKEGFTVRSRNGLAIHVEIRYAPSMDVNLMSTFQFQDMGFTVCFDIDSTYLSNKQTGQVHYICGPRRGNLHFLDLTIGAYNTQHSYRHNCT